MPGGRAAVRSMPEARTREVFGGEDTCSRWTFSADVHRLPGGLHSHRETSSPLPSMRSGTRPGEESKLSVHAS
jgi:hypothetical protein